MRAPAAPPPLRLRLVDRRLELVPGRPLLMGVVNATPDSFSDAGKLPDAAARIAHGRALRAAGAALLDVGGVSAVGGRREVGEAEELARVVPVIEALAADGALVSVDTHRPRVAEAAVAAGARMVNDVSGLRDPALADVCARTGAALVVMHTRVAPGGTLLDPAFYPDVVADVVAFLLERVALAGARGVEEEQIVLDPGPDFAKTPAQTVAVLRDLGSLHALGRPVLLAVSRKDFVGALTGGGPCERGAGTLAALAAGVDAGAQLLRVHDVAAARDFLAVRAALRGAAQLVPDAGLTPDRYPSGPSLASFPAMVAGRCAQRGRAPTDHPGSPEGVTMSSVLSRAELGESPLSDLHLLANELGVDGFRRLRRDDLIDAIVERQGGSPPDEAPPALADPVAVDAAAEPAQEAESAEAATPDVEAAGAAEDEESTTRGRRGRRGGRGRSRTRAADVDEAPAPAPEAETPEPGEEHVVEGVVELLGNGSGFIRLSPPEPTDDDVYVSAAQVKRCELVSGDRVAGPVRAPRRSERFPSLVRVDTINGRPAEEVAEGTRFEELAVAFPTVRLAFGGDDPTVQAIEWLTPIGRGSRALITGAALAGKSEALRRIATALAGQAGLEVTVVLTGVRPEEVGEWPEPVAVLPLGASSDAQAQAVEHAVEQGRRVAARGGDAVVVVDTLDYLPDGAARRALAAARNLAQGGSLTVIATASEPLGGESTVVALDRELTALRRFPALDLSASGTLRPELLVGESGAEAIARARAEAGLAPTGL